MTRLRVLSSGATGLPPRRQLKISYSKNLRLSPGRFGAATFLSSYGALQPMPLAFVRDILFNSSEPIGAYTRFLLVEKVVVLANGRLQLDAKKLRERGIRITSEKTSATRLAVLSLNVSQAESEKAKVFITAYNAARTRMYTQQGKPYMGDFLLNSKERMSRVSKIIQFLDRLSVSLDEYSAYVYSIFQAKGWREAPSLYRFIGTVAADIWNNRRTEALSILSNESLQVVEYSLSPWKDVDPMQEKQKSSWLRRGSIENCLLRFSDFNGYHPKSEACGSCSLAQACRQMLLSSLRSFLPHPELILSVRSGEVAMEQLADEARSLGHQFDSMRPPWQMSPQLRVPETELETA